MLSTCRWNTTGGMCHLISHTQKIKQLCLYLKLLEKQLICFSFMQFINFYVLFYQKFYVMQFAA